jgi:hypothetical protein
MKPTGTSRIFVGYIAMVLTIAVAVTLFSVADVQISLAYIDPSDPSTSPNMAPQIRYYFIPFLAAALAVASVLFNLLLDFIQRRRLFRLSHWMILGAAYGLAASSLLTRYFSIGGALPLLLGPALAICAVLLVRWRYGSSPHAV